MLLLLHFLRPETIRVLKQRNLRSEFFVCFVNAVRCVLGCVRESFWSSSFAMHSSNSA
jgi:hypothetical protein